MKPNRRNISRLPIKYILNPDISEDSDLPLDDDSEDDYQKLNHDSSDSENKSLDNKDESSSDSDDDDTNHAQQTQNEHKVQWVEVDPENISVNTYLSYFYSTVSFIWWKYFIFWFYDVHFSETA